MSHHLPLIKASLLQLVAKTKLRPMHLLFESFMWLSWHPVFFKGQIQCFLLTPTGFEPKTFPFSQKLSNYCFLDCPHTQWKSRVEALESELEWIRGARFYKGWRKWNVNGSDREELPVPSSWNLVYVFVCVLFPFSQNALPLCPSSQLIAVFV